MVFSFLFWFFSLLAEFHCALVRPDGVDAHGSPAFFVDVVEGDGLPVIESLLLRCSFVLRHVVGWYEIGASSASRMTDRTVFLDELKEYDALVERFFQIWNVHRLKLIWMLNLRLR